MTAYQEKFRVALAKALPGYDQFFHDTAGTLHIQTSGNGSSVTVRISPMGKLWTTGVGGIAPQIEILTAAATVEREIAEC